MKHDQEDEYYEKDIDELAGGLPGGFHIVDEEAEKDDPLLTPLTEDEDEEAVEDDDLELDTGPSEFGGKDFDFEHAEEEE